MARPKFVINADIFNLLISLVAYKFTGGKSIKVKVEEKEELRKALDPSNSISEDYFKRVFVSTNSPKMSIDILNKITHYALGFNWKEFVEIENNYLSITNYYFERFKHYKFNFFDRSPNDQIYTRDILSNVLNFYINHPQQHFVVRGSKYYGKKTAIKYLENTVNKRFIYVNVPDLDIYQAIIRSIIEKILFQLIEIRSNDYLNQDFGMNLNLFNLISKIQEVYKNITIVFNLKFIKNNIAHKEIIDFMGELARINSENLRFIFVYQNHPPLYDFYSTIELLETFEILPLSEAEITRFELNEAIAKATNYHPYFCFYSKKNNIDSLEELINKLKPNFEKHLNNNDPIYKKSLGISSDLEQLIKQ